MESSRKGKPVKTDAEERRCLYCGQQAPLVWVHGHGQCAACGINVDECCRGESCNTEFKS